jgi:hypothetical protein
VGPFAHNLARLHALTEAGMPLPPDLAQWTITQVEAQAPPEYLRKLRDDRLREAGAMIGGSVAAQVDAILRIAASLDRIAANRTIDGTHVAVRTARGFARIPRRRRLAKILAGCHSMHSAP